MSIGELPQNAISCNNDVVWYEGNHTRFGKTTNKRFVGVCDWKIHKVHNNMKREKKILDLCEHKNIQKCYDVIQEPNGFLVGLIYEPVDKRNLKDLLLGEDDLTWDDKFRIAKEYADALSHMHSKSIVYNAGKTKNIYFSERKQVKLTNFGWARMIKYRPPSMESLNRKQKDPKPDFYSEPVVQHSQYLTTEVNIEPWMDVYSYAMVLYELITRKKIYQDEKPPCIFDVVVSFKRPSLDPVNKISESLQPDSEDIQICNLLRDIMERCWQPEPEKRPTMNEVLRELATFASKRAKETRKRKAEMTRDTRDLRALLGSVNEACDAREDGLRFAHSPSQNMTVSNQTAGLPVDGSLNDPPPKNESRRRSCWELIRQSFLSVVHLFALVMLVIFVLGIACLLFWLCIEWVGFIWFRFLMFYFICYMVCAAFVILFFHCFSPVSLEFMLFK